MTDNQLLLEMEQALTGLVKLMKALRFYPKGHPRLREAIDECLDSFQPMLRRQDNRAIQVTQNGFSRNGVKIGETNLALPELARLLAERRVNQLIFLTELQPQELLILLEGLSTPFEEIYHLGGLPVFLHDRRITTIWLNESSLDIAREKRQKLVDEEIVDNQIIDPSDGKKADITQQLQDVIARLNRDLADDDYRAQIDKLLQLAPPYFEQSAIPGMLRILPLLFLQSEEQKRSLPQRRSATRALDHLLTGKVTEQLLKQLKQTALTPQQFRRLLKFIVSLGLRIAPQLLTQLSNEPDSTVRKRLTMLLGRMGEPLLDLLRETVHSNKWFVVRNAVVLLGDLRLEAGIDILTGLTEHPDQRVRRALIRALAMVGGNKAVDPLLRMVSGPVIPLRQPAVKALGATRSSEAVQPLLAIAQKFDPFNRQTEMRIDAVSALGILEAKDAVAPLLTLAKRPNWLRLSRLEKLRAETIQVLGKLGDKNLKPALEHWLKSPHRTVQRAAEQSLNALTKKYDNCTTD